MGQAKPLTGSEMPVSRNLGRQRPPDHTEEIAVHHIISYQLAQARVADLRHRAERDTLARAARRARPDRDRQVRGRPSPRTVLAIASLRGSRWAR